MLQGLGAPPEAPGGLEMGGASDRHCACCPAPRLVTSWKGNADFGKTHPFRVSLFPVFPQKTAKYGETAFVSRDQAMGTDSETQKHPSTLLQNLLIFRSSGPEIAEQGLFGPRIRRRAKTPLVGRLQMAIVRAFLTPVAAAERGTLTGSLGQTSDSKAGPPLFAQPRGPCKSAVTKRRLPYAIL